MPLSLAYSGKQKKNFSELGAEMFGPDQNDQHPVAIHPSRHCQLQELSSGVLTAIIPAISSHNVKPCQKLYHTVAEMAFSRM